MYHPRGVSTVGVLIKAPTYIIIANPFREETRRPLLFYTKEKRQIAMITWGDKWLGDDRSNLWHLMSDMLMAHCEGRTELSSEQ